MILKMKAIFLILIINFGSGQSTCMPKGRQVKILPSKIPKSIGSYATEDGYRVDWEGAIQPRDMAGCLDEVVLHYNGEPDTGCCDGYQEVTKKPKSGDLEPFLIPELCGNKTKAVVFVTFKIQKQKQTSPKLTLTNLRACPEENKGLFEEHKDLLIPIVVCGVVLTIILILCCVMCLLEKNKKNQDEESTEISDEKSEEPEEKDQEDDDTNEETDEEPKENEKSGKQQKDEMSTEYLDEESKESEISYRKSTRSRKSRNSRDSDDSPRRKSRRSRSKSRSRSRRSMERSRRPRFRSRSRRSRSRSRSRRSMPRRSRSRY